MLIFVTNDARDGTLAAMAKTRRWMADAGVTFRQGYVTTPSFAQGGVDALRSRGPTGPDPG